MSQATQADFFEGHPYIEEVNALEQLHTDRRDFHKAVEPVLVKMGRDKAFLYKVIERNFKDEGWLNFDWSDYNIPFFYVHETDDYILKIHLFPAGGADTQHYAAHAIHHHNNYILTTYAFFGSGYESMLFDKDVTVDERSLKSSMRVNKHFHQKDWNPSRVDSWEPHIVFLPESLSATLLMWSPDVKRKTDSLRNNRLLKPFKKELRHLIYRLGMGDKLGIAREKTYQFYVDSGTVQAISEEDYFSKSRSANGPKEKEYAMQMIFSFLQRTGIGSAIQLAPLIENMERPDYFKTWFDKYLRGEEIPEVFHRYKLNIPNDSYTRQDIIQACS